MFLRIKFSTNQKKNFKIWTILQKNWPLWCHKWPFFSKGSFSKIDQTFFHNSMYILGVCEEKFYGDHAHAGRTKYDFPPPRLYFYTILTIMTSQMVILLNRAILKNWPNFFHNSMCILGCCEEQFYGNHDYLNRTKYDFPHPRLYFYSILTIMTSQMVTLLRRASSKIAQNFFHTSIHMKGSWQVQFFGNHIYVSRIKNDFTLQDFNFTLFWPVWRHKWPFCSEGTSSKISQTFFTTLCIF